MEFRVVRSTTHFDAACALYATALGWPVTREWDEPQRGRIFGYGNARIELMEADHDEPITGVFVSLEHDGVDALHDRLRAAGATIVQTPTDQPWGQRNLAVLDPAGLKVVFFQWL